MAVFQRLCGLWRSDAPSTLRNLAPAASPETYPPIERFPTRRKIACSRNCEGRPLRRSDNWAASSNRREPLAFPPRLPDIQYVRVHGACTPIRSFYRHPHRDHVVIAASFGSVHRLVHASQKTLWHFTRLVFACGNRDCDFAYQTERRCADSVANVVGDMETPIETNARQEDNELVSTDPKDEISWPGRRTDHIGNRLEHVVTNEVPERVIHSLEAIDVEHEHR